MANQVILSKTDIEAILQDATFSSVRQELFQLLCEEAESIEGSAFKISEDNFKNVLNLILTSSLRRCPTLQILVNKEYEVMSKGAVNCSGEGQGEKVEKARIDKCVSKFQHNQKEDRGIQVAKSSTQNMDNSKPNNIPLTHSIQSQQYRQQQANLHKVDAPTLIPVSLVRNDSILLTLIKNLQVSDPSCFIPSFLVNTVEKVDSADNVYLDVRKVVRWFDRNLSEASFSVTDVFLYDYRLKELFDAYPVLKESKVLTSIFKQVHTEIYKRNQLYYQLVR